MNTWPSQPLWDDSTSNGTISKIATSQIPATLPSWLTTHPDDLVQELHSMYGKVPSMMGTQGIEKAYDDSIATTRGMGGQIANNASREAVARAGITGGQINSEMVKAQSMLPVYDATNKLTTEKAQAVADQKKSQAGLMAQIAQGLGSLRTDYLSHLSQIQVSSQAQNNAWTSGQQQMRMGAQQADRAYQLSMQELAQRSNAATVGRPTGNNTPGYIPNSGPVQDAFVNGIRQNNTASVGSSATANFGWAPTPGRKTALPQYQY